MLQTSDKEKIFKLTSKKWHSKYRRKKIRKTSDFSSDTRSSEKTVEIFKSTQEKKKIQPRILYSEKVSFKNKGEIKTFSDKSWKNSALAHLHENVR